MTGRPTDEPVPINVEHGGRYSVHAWTSAKPESFWATLVAEADKIPTGEWEEFDIDRQWRLPLNKVFTVKQQEAFVATLESEMPGNRPLGLDGVWKVFPHDAGPFNKYPLHIIRTIRDGKGGSPHLDGFCNPGVVSAAVTVTSGSSTWIGDEYEFSALLSSKKNVHLKTRYINNALKKAEDAMEVAKQESIRICPPGTITTFHAGSRIHATFPDPIDRCWATKTKFKYVIYATCCLESVFKVQSKHPFNTAEQPLGLKGPVTECEMLGIIDYYKHYKKQAEEEAFLRFFCVDGGPICFVSVYIHGI